MAFSFYLISEETKGYLSFVRQISAINIPKIPLVTGFFISQCIYILQQAIKLLFVISPIFRDNKVILDICTTSSKGDLVCNSKV